MRAPHRRGWHRLWQIGIATATLLPACRSDDAAPTGQPAVAPRPTAAASDDVWEAYFLQGAKIGYGHTAIRRLDRAGEPLVETQSLVHLKLERFGQPVEEKLTLSTLESPAGALLEFRTEAATAGAPVVTTGHVEGDELVVQTETKGARRETRLPWSPGVRGFLGVELSLAHQPLAPGESRTLRMMMPLVNQVADVELTAVDDETTSVMGSEAKLLRIENATRLPDGNSMAETLWTDRAGNVIKRRIEGMGQESHRTTEKLAKSDAIAAPTIDIGTDTVVPIDPPLARAHQTREVRYRVELPMGDPTKTFATGPTQSVRRLGPHMAQLTVRSIRPGEAAPPDGEPPATIDDAYLAANSVLQIDDARVRQMADEARGNETDPVQIALALERYVHGVMAMHDFSQAFATAAEVAETRSGDCTEHAVLLAALARACGIPSRVAIGLVYVESAQAFGFHMWTEMYLGGQWIALDGTLGQGGIGAAHLKLVDSSLDGASAYSAFLPVAQVLGQLKVEVVEAR